MATTKDLRKSIIDMNREEGMNLILSIRNIRRIPIFNKMNKKAKEKRKVIDLNNMSYNEQELFSIELDRMIKEKEI